MNAVQAENSRPEKALWYQEVLSLDPASRIFLPYARLLSENGRRIEAIEILRAGLARHPEFLDARLMLIDLLHAAGQDAAAGQEASGIIESLSRCSALWEVWSKLPGMRADQSAMLLFFGATFRKDGPSLADVFEAGMRALRESENTPGETENTSSASEEKAPISRADTGSSAPAEAPTPQSDVTPATLLQSEGTPSAEAESKDAGRCFVMDENTPWYSLDSVPDDDDISDDDETESVPRTATLSPSVTELFFAERPESGSEGDDEHSPAARSVPRAPLEGKSSLCTRSMARILEEQGATVEAADIYRELLEVSSSPEEKAELNAKLDSLRQGTENPVPGQPAASGIMDMLETLAVRLENKSRA